MISSACSAVRGAPALSVIKMVTSGCFAIARSKMKFSMWRFAVVGAVGFIIFPVFAQKRPWEEYDKHIASKMTVSALSNDLFHEQVDLYNGRLSFRHVDIDISGNSSLPVTLARTFSVQDRSGYAPGSGQVYTDLPLADWDLDLPRISGTFGERFIGRESSTHAWYDQRCSGLRSPERIGPFLPSDYWYGIHADMPGGGEMLVPAASVGSPSVGGPYRWVTAGFTWFSCLASIKNGTGEGFLAIAADGTKYWFDWMAKYNESVLERYDIGSAEQLFRKRHVLYATRVEDRFGNWVTYSFSNAASSPARLNRIQSNDGRQIDITYNIHGNVSSASDGARTWTYHYASQNDGYYSTLTSVVLPDSSRWLFNLESILGLLTYTGMDATCDRPGWSYEAPENSIGTITHPSGAVGEFEIGQRLHGRSNVPKNCLGTYPDTYSDYARTYWGHSLLRKRVVGPGLSPIQWEYTYNDSHRLGDDSSGASYSPPGSWAPGPYTYTRIAEDGKPLTDPSTYVIADPVCMSDVCAGKITTEVRGPAGEWSRYTYGNSYRYNEHKLLKVERGTGPSDISSIEQFTYELSQSGQPFPAQVGVSRQYKGDSMTEAYLRPSRSKTVIQDGVVFKSVINSFDAFGRPLSVTKSSAPSP